MLMLAVVQILFAVAALAFCAAAARDAVARSNAVGFHLMLAGATGLVFFMSVPSTPFELPLIAVVTAFTGMLLAPRIEPIGADDDLDIGESTATRRLRK